MTSPLSREELRESFKHLFTSYESDLEEGLRLVDRYAQQVAIEAEFNGLYRAYELLNGTGVWDMKTKQELLNLIQEKGESRV